MNNTDDEKTRISKTSEQQPEVMNERTRVAPSKAGVEKTPVASPRKVTESESSIIANSQEKAASNSDNKTRIAPSKTDADVDKTRIVSTRKTSTSKASSSGISQKVAAARDNKTRIAPGKQTPRPDATRFKPRKNNDATRVKSKPAQRTGNSDLEPGDNTASETGLEGGQKPELLKNRFILEKVLGAGGMGVVYKAKDLVKVEAGDKEPYLAIKVLTEEFKEHPEAFVALQRESRKTQSIAHPNIVNVHDFDKDGDTVFMTMEYLDGKPLDQLIRQYKSTGLPTDDAREILNHISQALMYAHEQHIIHSDFKPGNIFVTERGATKVFDFGIARAVAKAEHYDDNPEDKTVFDAGDLGALTPSYASMEMLEGEEPDVRDDIYALGCVAYELFTGSHPFNRVPADEAQRQKLKPKRITHISMRQWKAIERALSFKREDRLESVGHFYYLMNNAKSPFKLLSRIFLMALLVVAGYFVFLYDKPQGISEDEIRSEVEYKIRLENYRATIDDLLSSVTFTSVWEERLWTQMQGVKKLLSSSDKWLALTTNLEFKAFLQNSNDWYGLTEEKIYLLYVDKIKQVKADKKYTLAINFIKNALRYTSDSSLLDEEMRLVNEALASADLLAEEQRKKRLLQEENRKRNIAASSSAKFKKQSDFKNKLTKKQVIVKQFNIAMNNVKELLACQSNKLNMRNLDTAIQKLRSLDKVEYRKSEANIINLLASCIQRIAKPFPERATEFKKYSLRIFRNNRKLAAITIVPRDPCDKSIAGLGARGKRALCKDQIGSIGNGPELVVIPGKSGIRTFALGKYEVSIAEFNLFCKSSKSCKAVKSSNLNLPITRITLKLAEKYLKWLSKKTKRKYRLPTKKEWLYAAKGKRVTLDPNRNCKLNTRGINKGDAFVRTTIGVQNSWGLVNYVGNASEWAYDKGRKLIAAGGAYNVPMERCNISTLVKHNGKADSYTGLRVLREMR